MLCQQAQRHHSAGTGNETDLAVATKSIGMDGDRFHHRFPATDCGTLLVEDRAAIPQHGDIRRRPAHIGNQNRVFAAEIARTDQAGGRTGQDGFDRAGQRQFGTDQ